MLQIYDVLSRLRSIEDGQIFALCLIQILCPTKFDED